MVMNERVTVLSYMDGLLDDLSGGRIMRGTVIACCLLSIILTGCREASVFEKRYVRIEIPGYTERDYMRLLESKNPDLRYLALANLLEMDAFKSKELLETTALPQKLQGLLADASPKVRAIAAFSIRSLEPGDFETALSKLLEDESDAVRLEALATLGKRCSSSTETAHILLGRLEDKSTLVRLQAIEVLSECRKSTGRSEIVKWLLAKLPDSDRIEQLKAINTLGVIGQIEEVEPTLLALIQSDDEAVLTVAAEALGRQGSVSAVEFLLNAIREKRGNAEIMVEALRSIGTPEAMQALSQLLSVDRQELRVAVIKAIGEAEGDVGFEELLKRFSQEELRIREEVDSVKWADASSYIEFAALLEAIKSKKFGGLDKFAEPPVTELLASEKIYEQMLGLSLLTEGKPYDRIVVGLGQEKHDLFPQLERLSKSPSPLVRILALQALGNTIDNRALPILEANIDAPAFGIRHAAIEALGTYVQNTGDYSPLRWLYEMRGRFVPDNYSEDDGNFVIRRSIEKMIAGEERNELTRKRRVLELTSDSAPTRLLVAFELADNKDNAGLPTLLQFLETGSVPEKQFAVKGIEELSFASAETISKLETLEATETNPEVRKKTAELVEKLRAK